MPFKKAKPEQAALKISGYGPPGSGKTFTSLLIAEGLSKTYGKRVAFVDTEHGTDFYAMSVASRKVHPEAFDFDVIYTRSLFDLNREIRNINPKEYCCLVIDSMTHFWETAIASYTGKKTGSGSIPMHAWGRIKQPYKDAMKFVTDSELHVIILGRQGNEFSTDENGDISHTGYKMKAEGETAYEPHICLRFSPQKNQKTNIQTIGAIVEKDRTGVLQGAYLVNPEFKHFQPILSLLGGTQATLPDDEEAARSDAEEGERLERMRLRESAELRDKLIAKCQLCEDRSALEALGKEITPAVKKKMNAADCAAVREAWVARDNVLRGEERADS